MIHVVYLRVSWSEQKHGAVREHRFGSAFKSTFLLIFVFFISAT